MAKLDELKSLSPQERIRKLKEMEEERKNEIEQAEKLIKESNVEIEEERKELERIPIPQLKTVDIQGLFTAEEREIFKVKRFVEEKGSLEDELKEKESKRLEETVREEAERKEKDGLDRERLGQTYQIVKDMFEKAREEHYLNPQERATFYQGVREINEAAKHYAHENHEVAHIRDIVSGEAEGLRKYMGFKD